ncbi:unnamed protein product, partial [Closterium sp. NIES-54]
MTWFSTSVLATAAPAEFLDRNPPPMYITLYFIVTRLPDSIRSVRDHFLSLDPTVLTVDLLEQHLLAAGTRVVAVGAARGTPRTPFFEGCSPSPLAPSYASAAAVDVLGAEDVRDYFIAGILSWGEHSPVVARTSMIHAATPHFLWPFAVRYAAHQLNPWTRVSLPKTSPTLRWMGKVGDASVFRDVMFDKSVPFYLLFPNRSAPPPPPPLFLAPSPPPVDPHPPQGPTPSGVSQEDPLPSSVPVEVAVGSGAARGAASEGTASGGAEPGGAESEGARSGGAEPGGAEPGGAEPGGAEPAGVEPGGAECEGAESGGAEPRGSASSGDHAVELPELETLPLETMELEVLELVVPEVLQLHVLEVLVPGVLELPGLVVLEALELEELQPETLWSLEALELEALALVALELETLELLALELEALALVALALEELELGVLCLAVLIGGLTEGREPASCPALPVRVVHAGRRVLRPRPPPLPGTHAMALRPSSVPLRFPLPPPPESSLPAVPEPEYDLARAASPTIFRLLATIVTYPSFESTSASALIAELVDFAATCLLDYANALVAESQSASHPSVGGECALGTDVLEDRQEEFEYLAAAVPRFASMLLAPEGDPDAPDIPTPRSYAEAIEGPYSSQWQAAMDAEMASWKSTGIYVDAVPPSRANIVDDGMWIFRVKWLSGSPPTFKARYVAQGFSQCQGVNYFHTFSPTPKMTTLWMLLHVAAQRDYELHSLDFSIAFLQGSLHEEIWLRRPPGFTRSFPAGLHLRLLGLLLLLLTRRYLRTDTSVPPFYVLVYVDDLVFATTDTEALTLVKSELQKRHTCTDLGELRTYLGLQITRVRARCTITLTQSDMVHQVLQHLGFQFSSPQPTPVSTSHSLSTPPSDESVEPIGPYPELVGCLMYLMTCTRPDLAYPLSLLARYMAPGRHRKVHWDAAKRVLRYLCSTSGMGLFLGGCGPVVLTGHADASWVDDRATQRSSQGYTFSLGSGFVSW